MELALKPSDGEMRNVSRETRMWVNLRKGEYGQVLLRPERASKMTNKQINWILSIERQDALRHQKKILEFINIYFFYIFATSSIFACITSPTPCH
jgi:hypothetical protein